MNSPTHEELVVAYHCLHKVYTYLAQCDNDLVAVNLYAVNEDPNGLTLMRLAQTGRGADYALPEELAGDRSEGKQSAAAYGAALQSRVGFYIPSDKGKPSAFALPSDTEPAQFDHLRESYSCALLLLAEGFKSDDGKTYSFVLISRCQTNDKRGYWLESTLPSADKVPLLRLAEAHLNNARDYLKWGLTHWREHHSISAIRAWNRLPIVTVKNKDGLLHSGNLVNQVHRHQIKFASVLFADIRGFTNLTTTISQSQSAILAQFLTFLSSTELDRYGRYPVGYFEAAHKVINCYGGQLDKFMGDGVMGIFFNSDSSDDVVDAHVDMELYEVLAQELAITTPPSLELSRIEVEGDARLAPLDRNKILEIRKRITRYNKSLLSTVAAIRCGISLVALFDLYWQTVWQRRICLGADGRPIKEIDEATKAIGLGVGVCGGPLVAGYFGSRWQDQFTVLGDTVNRAQRMESHARKDYVSVPGKSSGPNLIVHIPAKTLFSGLCEFNSRLSKCLKDNAFKKLTAKIPMGKQYPLADVCKFFLADEEAVELDRFPDYAVSVECFSIDVTTQKPGKRSGFRKGSGSEEPALGYYVNPTP